MRSGRLSGLTDSACFSPSIAVRSMPAVVSISGAPDKPRSAAGASGAQSSAGRLCDGGDDLFRYGRDVLLAERAVHGLEDDGYGQRLAAGAEAAAFEQVEQRDRLDQRLV